MVYDPPGGNRRLAQLLADWPRLRGLVVVDPRRLDEAARDLDALLPGGRFVGVKIHPYYAATPIDSPAMRDALALVGHYHVPALHAWGSNVVDLARLTDTLPDVRVIAGHMGGPGWRHVPAAATRCERVWFEPCCSQPVTGRLVWVIERIGVARMLFGTDATLIDPSLALTTVSSVVWTPPSRPPSWPATPDISSVPTCSGARPPHRWPDRLA